MSLMNILASGNENTKPFFENIKFLDRNERYKPIEPTWRPSANKLFRRKFLGRYLYSIYFVWSETIGCRMISWIFMKTHRHAANHILRGMLIITEWN